MWVMLQIRSPLLTHLTHLKSKNFEYWFLTRSFASRFSFANLFRFKPNLNGELFGIIADKGNNLCLVFFRV